MVLYAMRVKAAAVKHRVWTAVVLLMLLLPVWTAWGPKAPVRVLPSSVEGTVSEAVAPRGALSPAVAQPSAASGEILEPTTIPLSTGQEVLLGIYLLGLFSALARLAVGTVKANKLIQQAALRDGRHTSASCAAPVTVGWLHPTVILPEGWRQWPKARLDAVLTHECEHARRRDPLVQWLALLNRAVFWFHPAAWWLERELSSLAEEACDGAVLARGHDARAYAETLMDMARAVMRSGARVNVVSVAMPGAALPQRIQQIIENVPAPRISRTRMAFLAAACAITCAAFAAGRLDRAQARAAQSPAVPQWQTAAGGKMAFDVASVKPNISSNGPLNQLMGGLAGPGAHTSVPMDAGDGQPANGGLFSATDYPLGTYIAFAYKLTPYQTQFLVSKLPKWTTAERFDIEAHAGPKATKDQMRLMMQSLLADRFKLAVHFETRQGPVFALVLAKTGKTGPQLKPHSDDQPCTDIAPPPGSAPTPAYICGAVKLLPPSAPGRMHVSSRKISIGQIASYFPVMGRLDRAVLDRTGLGGNFDFSMEFAPDPQNVLAFNGPQPPDSQSDPSVPTFLEALKDQLGLKLEPRTGPVDVLIIDHVEEPSPN